MTGLATAFVRAQGINLCDRVSPPGSTVSSKHGILGNSMNQAADTKNFLVSQFLDTLGFQEDLLCHSQP